MVKSKMDKIFIVYSEKYLQYSFGKNHPFWPERTSVFLEKIKTSRIPFKILTPEKGKDKDILLVHSKKYLELVKKLAEENGFLSTDTPLTGNVLEAAYFSVGGSILILREALKGKKVINLLGGFHHACISSSSGFCIFNDHSIAIRKMQKEGRVKKVIIYDLDVHAGQGTQEIFYSDPSIFTISLHQDPSTLYPGTGFEYQKGEGKGEGYNLNIPLPPGTREKEYLNVLDQVLPLSDKFKPDLTVLVLGVDTYKDDPLASLELEESTYYKIGKKFKNFKKLGVVYAGGYSKKVPDLWLSFLRGYLR